MQPRADLRDRLRERRHDARPEPQRADRRLRSRVDLFVKNRAILRRLRAPRAAHGVRRRPVAQSPASLERVRGALGRRPARRPADRRRPFLTTAPSATSSPTASFVRDGGLIAFHDIVPDAYPRARPQRRSASRCRRARASRGPATFRGCGRRLRRSSARDVRRRSRPTRVRHRRARAPQRSVRATLCATPGRRRTVSRHVACSRRRSAATAASPRTSWTPPPRCARRDTTSCSLCARSDYAARGRRGSPTSTLPTRPPSRGAAVPARPTSCICTTTPTRTPSRPCAASPPAVLSAHAYPGCTPNTHYFAPGEECDSPHGPGCVVNMALRGCLHARDPRPVPREVPPGVAPDGGLRAGRRGVCYSTADRSATCVATALTRTACRCSRPMEALTTAPRDEQRAARLPGALRRARGGREGASTCCCRRWRRSTPTLTVVGDGLALAAARALAADLGHERRACGSRDGCPATALTAAYRRAAVVAVPSVWPEPFGLVGLEAMAAVQAGGREPDRRDRRLARAEGHRAGRRAGQRARTCGAALATVLDDPAPGAGDGQRGARVAGGAIHARTHHVAALEAAYGDAARRWSSRRADR